MNNRLGNIFNADALFDDYASLKAKAGNLVHRALVAVGLKSGFKHITDPNIISNIFEKDQDAIDLAEIRKTDNDKPNGLALS